MEVHIDSNFVCHAEARPDTQAVESAFFDDKPCAGYRYIPLGKEWRNSNGVVFAGEMIAPVGEE